MDTQSKSDNLSRFEKKIMAKKGGKMWVKDYRVNFPVDGDQVFDDFFKISPHLCS